MKKIVRVTSGDSASGESPDPIGLSADGSFVFYADNSPPADFEEDFFENEYGLFDSQTGTTQTVIPLGAQQVFDFDTSLSGDGRFVAYIQLDSEQANEGFDHPRITVTVHLINQMHCHRNYLQKFCPFQSFG
jgi:hypothetical protein